MAEDLLGRWVGDGPARELVPKLCRHSCSCTPSFPTLPAPVWLACDCVLPSFLPDELTGQRSCPSTALRLLFCRRAPAFERRCCVHDAPFNPFYWFEHSFSGASADEPCSRSVAAMRVLEFTGSEFVLWIRLTAAVLVDSVIFTGGVSVEEPSHVSSRELDANVMICVWFCQDVYGLDDKPD